MKLALVWLTLIGVGVSGQTRGLYPEELTARGRRIAAGIYSLNYDAAEELARRLEADLPAEPLGPALHARVLWSRQLAAERALSIERLSGSDFFSAGRTLQAAPPAGLEEEFREATGRAIAKAKARLAADPKDWAARHTLGLAYQHLAAFEFSVKRRWWAAYRTGEAMFEAERAVMEAEPGFPDTQFAAGVSQYLAAALPAGAKLFAVLFGLRGNRAAGLQKLENVAREGIFNADDARTILALLYARDKDFDRSAAKLRELMSAFPDNYLVALELGGVFLLARRYDDALHLYRGLLARAGRPVPGYRPLAEATVFNRLGVACRMKGNLGESVSWFERALAAQTDPGLTRSAAHLELGKSLDLKQKRNAALEQYRAVLAAPDIAGCHREARALLSRPYREER
ncbi:MAG: tetratricopeptide repeat protein [Bryobacterales bacterium]|nr:tetratricopeptide repeat protein [Bryobacterales bacterium]